MYWLGARSPRHSHVRAPGAKPIGPEHDELPTVTEQLSPDPTSRNNGGVASRNRIDPFGDMRAVPTRGVFTGNRGCLVNDSGELVRHHVGMAWITCVIRYRDSTQPLNAPHTWTPLFFLDDAVALAAGHRPCGRCRRDDYLRYRAAVHEGLRATSPLSASDIDRRLNGERLTAGRGLDRRGDRLLWRSLVAQLPVGAVVVDGTGIPLLVIDDGLRPFSFSGWGQPRAMPADPMDVLTPQTSTLALAHGFVPHLHASATNPAFVDTTG